MTASSLIKDVAGVVGCVVGDSDGCVLECRSDDRNSENVVAAASYAEKQLVQLGSHLGLGQPVSLSIIGVGNPWVVVMQRGHVFVAECENARAVTNIESTLSSVDWTTHIETSIEETELEYIPLVRTVERKKPDRPVRERQPSSELKPTTVTKPIATTKTPWAKPAPNAARPNVPRPAANAQETAATPQADLLLSELRRTLIHGQLKQAEGIAAKLSESSKVRGETSDAVPLAPQLLEGIASVLAGDALRGLVKLKAIASSSKSTSQSWASLIWCTRASVSAGLDFPTAKSYANAALALAAQLDTEAQAVSTFELANVALNQADAKGALELARTARQLLGSHSDRHLLSGFWLLEARILGAFEKHEESLSAARQARDQRPSWPPPATFMARRALRDGRLDEAERLLRPLLEADCVATEVERTHRIIEYVRAGVAPVQAAFDFLEVVDLPPTPKNIRKLEALSNAYPNIEHFPNALGWQLIRTGQYELAASVFERLASRNDLSDDVRSSLLLALGFLASATSDNTKPEVRIRAAVEATPKNFKSVKPLPPSSGKMRVAVPVEFRTSSIPQLPSSDQPSSASGAELRRKNGSVFSGNLQLFALPDLMEFLRSGQRTGTLLCSSSAGIGAIHLQKGRITGAASPRTKGLKDYLVAMGVVTTATLEKVEQNVSGERRLIGGLLVKAGLATPAQVKLALRDQVHDAVKELMSWGAGQFAFDPESTAETSTTDVQVEFDPQEVLLNLFKEMDEKSLSGR